MAYNCYKGSTHIGNLTVGNRDVLAVCKGGSPVWRRSYAETIEIVKSGSISAPCDCDSGIRIKIYNARASHYTHSVTLYHNDVVVERQNVTLISGGSYHREDEGDYTIPIKKGDTFKAIASGTGTSTVTLYFDGFAGIPQETA